MPAAEVLQFLRLAFGSSPRAYAWAGIKSINFCWRPWVKTLAKGKGPCGCSESFRSGPIQGVTLANVATILQAFGFAFTL